MGLRYSAVPSFKWIGLLVIECTFLILCAKTKADVSCAANDPNCPCIIGPQDMTVLSNTSVSLPCNFTKIAGYTVQWIQGTVALGSNPDIPAKPRYSMNTDYSLIIQDVQLSDQNTYRCQVDLCQSDPATLTVYVLPSNPSVASASSNGVVDVVESDVTSLECSTSHAKPSATVWWYNKTGSSQMNASEVTTQDGGTFSSTSTTVFTPTAYDMDAQLTCFVESEALGMRGPGGDYISTTITLNVISKPSTFTLNGATTGGTLTIDLDSSASVSCEATSTELGTALSWKRDGVTEPSSTTQESLNGSNAVLFTTTIKIPGTDGNNGATYQCTVTIPGITRSYQDSLDFTITIYKFPLGWVIGGSVLGFILLIVLIVLIVCCIRRRKDKETMLSDPGDNTEMGIDNQSVENEVEVEPEVERVEETVVDELQQAASEFDTSSESEVAHTAADELESDDDDGNLNLPEGDVFSLSSSMMRSDRGSPVPNDGDLEEDDDYEPIEPGHLPPVTSIQSFYV